ncbi:hypothetical protein OG871_39870 (plasmid) [Kitasatospora sp. NBC_00374]|uniref:hypothetical protein n=1 Tax=Kitasatospora sp. NBC_00374 TaxID=2975964 RepID=UPI002F919E05
MGNTLTFTLPAVLAAALADDDQAGTCDQTGCDTEIDLGPASRCGTGPDGSAASGCGQHFCSRHLWLDGDHLTPQPQQCEPCIDQNTLRKAA